MNSVHGGELYCNPEDATGQPSVVAFQKATPENEGALKRGDLKLRKAATPALHAFRWTLELQVPKGSAPGGGVA